MRSGEEMTREEAIKVLKNPPRVYDEDMWTALDMAIEALSAQTDDDIISRQAAIEAVLELNTDGRVSWKDAVIDMLDALPSADAVQVVRCKDCKHYGTTDCQIQESFYGIKDFDFCSYGERERECEGGGDE